HEPGLKQHLCHDALLRSLFNPRLPVAGSRGEAGCCHATFTSIAFGLTFTVLGTCTFSTPFLNSAVMRLLSPSVGNRNRRTNLPYPRSTRWNVSPFSSFSSFRSPSIANTPSWKLPFPSSFLTSGRSAGTTHSVSVSLISHAGAQSPNVSPSPSVARANRFMRPSISASSRNGFHLITFKQPSFQNQ